MIKACAHTRLMNKSIGVCDPAPGWPSTVYDCGYRPQTIEQTLRIGPETSVKPDIIAVSNKERHALVIECKSGMNVKAEQEGRYAKLRTSTVKKWTRAKPPLEKHTVIYAINGYALERVSAHTSLPLMIFHESKLEGRGSFGSARLDRAMCGTIRFGDVAEPTEYYPYGPDDDDSIIAQYVLQGLMRVMQRRETIESISGDATVDRIFKINHRFHKILSDEASNRIKAKIRDVIKFQFLTDKKITRQLQKIYEGKHGASAWTRLLKACADNVEREASQKRL